jgi:class 3 adenylate cyclase/CHASE2 domain-containing sensor protein
VAALLSRGLNHWLAGLGALLIGLALAWLGPGAVLDGMIHDRLAPVLGEPAPAEDILVVLITEDDYQAKATPMALWSQHLVPFLNKLNLANPRAVGLDLVLPQFRLGRWAKGHDAKLMQALSRLKKTCRLVAGFGVEPDGSIRGPFALYQRILGSGGLGYLNVYPDPDGVLRSLKVCMPKRGGGYLKAFSTHLAGKADCPAPRPVFPDWRNPADIPRISFEKAMQSPVALFKERVVIIGVDFAFEDRHQTPAALHGEPGVIFQARLVNAMLQDAGLFDPGWLPSVLTPALAGLICFMLLSKRPAPARLGIALIGVLLGLGLFSLGLLALGVVARPAAGLASVCLFAAYRWSRGYSMVRSVFGRYVSGRVRDRILSGEIPLDGETLTVSLLFSDLRGFTGLGESLPPQKVVSIINLYFQAMTKEIRGSGGLVLQYVGDEIMAVFGAPLETPNHADQAVAAGIAMMRALRRLNQELAEMGHPALKHGIGVHCGQVVAGNVGGGHRLSYGLVGDAVNLASRIQGLNKEFNTEMLISSAVRDRLTRPLDTRKMPLAFVKGRAGQVQVYEVPQPESND